MRTNVEMLEATVKVYEQRGKGTALRRTLALAAVAGIVASAGIMASVALAPGTARAANPVPLPAALANHPFVTEKDASQLLAWGPGNNDPGNCSANTSEIQGDANNITLSTTGDAGDCTDVESPHTYPTTDGYVYESYVYFSNWEDWPAFWMYGNNWPSGGEIDAVEANFDNNGVSYHYGSASDPQYVSTFDNSGITPQSVNISPGWHTIDISFGGCGSGCGAISVWYDGKLYATVSGDFVVNGPDDPNWIVYSEGSCDMPDPSNPQDSNNVCAPGAEGVPGHIEVAWLRIFD